MYVYVRREKKRDEKQGAVLPERIIHNIYTYIHIYIYTYIYIYIYMCIYI